MFFKKLDYICVSPFYKSMVGLSVSKTYNTVASALILVLANFCIVYNAGVFIRNFLFGLSFFFIAYWVISILTYLLKKSYFGTFTRIIQRFWKRSLYLFWLLEISLFCIYLFLTLISPQEVPFMLDNQQLFFFYNGGFYSFFSNLFRPVIVIILGNIYLLSRKYNVEVTVAVMTLGILLVNTLYDDFIQFLSINNHYSNITWAHASIESPKDAISRGSYVGVWEAELVELKLRPYVHFLYLLVFLKMWHTLFIVYFFLFFENVRLYAGVSSFNIISANMQNFYFLLFFNFILKISYVKSYFNYIGGFVYYWFYTNHNAYDISYLYELFSYKYIFYFISDVKSLF